MKGTDGPILEMRGISKRFPGVLALDGVDFDLHRGEVHVLLGENGAGKSTLIKILAGVYPKDEGEIIFKGQKVEISSPHQAQQLGISIIHQEFNLIPGLSVAENIFLGREPLANRRLGWIDWAKLHRLCKKILDDLEMQISPRRLVSSLGVAQQQMVEVAKALSLEAEVIIMDEPTAALGEHEIDRLFATIRLLKRRGVSVIYISHRLQELTQIGDRVTVLRDGKLVKRLNLSETNRDELIRLMVGRDLGKQFPRSRAKIGGEALRIEEIGNRGLLKAISFKLFKGEILGLTGLVGSGRTELARAIFGADPTSSGRIYLEGERVRIKSPLDAVRLGIGYLTEDRKRQGLVMNLPLKDNVTLAALKKVTHLGFISVKKEKEVSLRYIEKLRIRPPSVRQKAIFLSGGTQQKVVLSKWLFTQAKVLIFDEPTRGIDVGAKVEVYQMMRELAEEGVAILMISSELPEVLAMSGRILVMHEGRIVGRFRAGEVTQEQILHCATGGIG